MAKIKNIEIFFLEYLFPKKFPYKEKINTMISTSNNEIKLTI